MKKITHLSIACAIALLGSAASAATDTVVLKDTRQYQPYIAAIGGVEGCKFPADPMNVKKGECNVAYERYIAGGEYTVRTTATGLCRHQSHKADALHTIKVDQGVMQAPSLSVIESVYKCEADGTAVSEKAN